MKKQLIPILLMSPLLAMATLHSSLLPKPQQIEYGNRTLPVVKLNIRLAGSSSDEERFAASELQRLILERTGIKTPLATANKASAAAIVLERTSSVDSPLTMPGDQPGPKSKEAYSIEIHPTGALLKAASSAGIFHGVQTLVQLVEGDSGRAVLPEVQIHDWPSLAFRGAMVDISEGQLATASEVKRQIDQLARWKGNQYYFYNEDSIELDGYPLLNPAARFSKAEIREIIGYARRRHIDVIPCLELYGHQHDLFRIEKYSDLADFEHGGEFDPTNPKIRPLLNGWIDQYVDLFPSHFAHIGFDETWEIARAARKQGAGTTPAKLFVNQIAQVAQRFKDHDRVVMAWADIMVGFPDIIPDLPAGLIAVPWYYDADPDPEYKHWLNPLAHKNVPTIIAPGINMFTEIVPDFDKSFRNIDTFLAAGRRSHALGVINTFWTDNQQVLRRMAWPGFAYGAAAAWQTDPMNPATFFSDYATIAYPSAAAPHIAEALRQLSAAEVLLQKVWGVSTMDSIWHNPFSESESSRNSQHRDDFRQARLKAESAEEELSAALAAGADPTALRSLIFGVRLLDFAGMRALYSLEIADLWKKEQAQNGRDSELWELISGSFSQTHGRTGDITDALSVLEPQYRENWLAEYTPYRLETALQNWNGEYLFWHRAVQRYERFRANYKEGTPLPPLETLLGD